MLKTRWHFVSLQSLLGRILPVIHCTSLHCWQLLSPFAHDCQHHPTSAEATMLGVVACVYSGHEINDIARVRKVTDFKKVQEVTSYRILRTHSRSGHFFEQSYVYLNG